MQTGMLWYERSPLTLAAKIDAAIEYFIKKYGRTPEFVLVSQREYSDGQQLTEIGIALKVEVRAVSYIMPCNMMIGFESPLGEAVSA